MSSALVVAAAVAMSAWYLASEKAIAGQWGFSLDDSWIYATFARNLATGHGFAFNPDQPIAGATGPLYVFLLAALYWAFHGVVVPAKVLGVLCLALSGVFTERTVRRVLPGRGILALFAGLLAVASPALVWGALSGLELPVYLALVCAGMYSYVSGRWALAVGLWSAGVWLRPDGLFLALAGAIIRPRTTPRSTVGLYVLAVAPLVALFAFDYSVGHTFFPNSVAVKATIGGNLIAREWSMATQWLWLWGLSLRPDRMGLHAPMLLPAIVAGSALLARRYPALVVYAFAFPLAFGLFGPSGGQHGRYIAYVIPISIVLACAGFDWFARRTLGSRARLVAAVIAVLCLAWEIDAGRFMASAHGWDVENINGMQRYLAEAASRATSPGDTIAVNDVGAMGYFSGCYIVDLVGLVTPKRAFPDNLSRYHPKFLIVFPEWFRPYAAPDPTSGQTVFYAGDSSYKYVPFLGVRLRTNVISSRNTMFVFERRGISDPAYDRVKLIEH